MAVTAETLLRSCASMEVPRVWVGDTARYFENLAMRLVAEVLGTSHRFAVANSPWADAAVERMMREIVRAFKTD